MSVCSGVIGNYNWVIVVVEHSDLTCVCKLYALVLACCLFDQSRDAAGDVVSCILAALPPGKLLFCSNATVFDCFAIFVVGILFR